MKERVETELGMQDKPFALLTTMHVKTEEDGDRPEVTMRSTVAEGGDESGDTTYEVNRDRQDPTLFIFMIVGRITKRLRSTKTPHIFMSESTS